MYFCLSGQLLPCGPFSIDTEKHQTQSVDISSDTNVITPLFKDNFKSLWNIHKIKANVMCNITFRSNGGFNVYLHSNAKIINDMAIGIEVKCQINHHSIILKLDPGEFKWVPVMTVANGI